MISPSQRQLTDNTQHSQQTDIHALVGFEPTTPAGERPKTHALDGAATGTGVITDVNPLGLEMDIYVKCEYFTNQKRYSYEIHEIL